MKEKTSKRQKVKDWMVDHEVEITLVSAGIVGGVMYYLGWNSGRKIATENIAKGSAELVCGGYLQPTLPGTGPIDTNSIQSITEWADKSIEFVKGLHKK